MNDIIVDDEAYEFVVGFDNDLIDDFDKRKLFLESVNTQKTVKFYESYKNVLRYINEEFIVVCEDYRYGFSAEHSFDNLVKYPDNVIVYKNKLK